NLPGMAYRCKNDLHWTMEFVSKGCNELTGYAPEDLIENKKLSYASLIHPDERAKVWEEIQVALAEKKDFKIFYRIITADSTTKHVLENGKGIFSSTGKLLALEGFISDVSDQKKAQEELLESKNYLDNILNSIADPIFVKDKNHEWILINKAFSEFIGYSQEELIEKSDYDFFPKNEADIFWQKDEEAFANAQENVNEEEITTSKGDVRNIITKKAVYTDETGEKYLVGVISDVTDLKDVEKRLRTSQEAYRGIFENINNAVAVYEAIDDGKNFIIKDFNHAGARIEKVDRKEIIGKNITDVFPGVEDFGILAALKRVWKTGTPEKFPVSFYEDERVSGWRENYIYKLISGEIVAVYEDLTKQVQAEEEINLNQKRLKSLVRILQYNPESVQDLLDYALEEAIKLTKSKIGYIYHYYPDKKEFILNTWSEGVMEECSFKKVPEVYELEKTGIWGEAVRQRESFIINDFQGPNPLKKGYPEGHAPLYKYMTLPIFSRNEIVAVVGVANKEEDYTETDLLQLELLMDAVWKGVDRQKFEEALKISETQYKAIFENTGTATAI
ncbi:MAG: PAS domain S-box protein, partial [Methanobacteriaceae archaeon]|nr:PAS domain S-box protein [Methanobacteriaceae archaeon]